MTQKEKLLSELKHNTYIRLLPSTTHGIGVFAIQDIPKGCRDLFMDEEGDWIKLTFEEVNELPDHSKKLIENFCLFDETDYFVPAEGFKKMDLSLYLNHSNQPNLTSIDEGRYFETTRDIKSGEEVFIDYGTIVDSNE